MYYQCTVLNYYIFILGWENTNYFKSSQCKCWILLAWTFC